MDLKRSLFTVVLAIVVTAGSAAAQDRAVTFNVRVGGDNPFTQLDDATTANFQTGLNFGGGIGLLLSPNLGLRGDVSIVSNSMRALGMQEATLNRMFLDAAVQFIYPTDSGWELFGSVGGGIARLSQDGVSGTSTTKPTAGIGAGMSYTFPGSNLGFSLEGKGWIYQFKDIAGAFDAYDKTMIEVGWTGGLSYRVPF